MKKGTKMNIKDYELVSSIAVDTTTVKSVYKFKGIGEINVVSIFGQEDFKSKLLRAVTLSEKKHG